MNAATSCGMAVIATRRDTTVPITAPMTIVTTIGTTWSRSSAANTTPTARIAPAAPIRLPLRAVFGPDSPLRARMKHTAATR